MTEGEYLEKGTKLYGPDGDAAHERWAKARESYLATLDTTETPGVRAAKEQWALVTGPDAPWRTKEH